MQEIVTSIQLDHVVKRFLASFSVDTHPQIVFRRRSCQKLEIGTSKCGE